MEEPNICLLVPPLRKGATLPLSAPSRVSCYPSQSTDYGDSGNLTVEDIDLLLEVCSSKPKQRRTLRP